jgi:hypothetical protein
MYLQSYTGVHNHISEIRNMYAWRRIQQRLISIGRHTPSELTRNTYTIFSLFFFYEFYAVSREDYFEKCFLSSAGWLLSLSTRRIMIPYRAASFIRNCVLKCPREIHN